MPQVFKAGSYWIYFWANESDPREPIHVHVSEGAPSADATKIWVTRSGKTLLANNNSGIRGNVLRNLRRIIEARSDEIVGKWKSFFGEVDFYC